jgi:hypothetical protein
LTRFFEDYQKGDFNEEHLQRAEWSFGKASNQQALNACWQLRSFKKYDETEKLKINAEANLEKLRPIYGENLTIRYNEIAIVICMIILLFTFSVELKSYFSEMKFEKEPEKKINF